MSATLLSTTHRQQLATSAIAEDIIAERGYTTDTRGLRLPIYQLGNPVAFASWFRPDHPSADEYGKIRKYLYPAGKPHVLDVLPRYAVPPNKHTPAPLFDRTVPLFVTEGVKKQDALTSLGVHAVPLGLAGTWAWGKKNADGDMELLPDWSLIPLRGRTVWLIFDSDAWRKESVYMALAELAEHLHQRGAIVSIVKLPDLPDGSKAGIDDLIARGWTAADLAQAAAPWDSDADMTFSTPSATLRANQRKFAKLCGELLRLDVGKQHMVKLTAIAHAHERLISFARAARDAPISSISTRLCSKLGGIQNAQGRYANYASVNTAVNALQQMEIVQVDVTWKPEEGRNESKATPGAYFADPLNAPKLEPRTPRPKAVIVPTTCRCGSDQTQISRVCHAESCAEPVTMFYDATSIRDDHVIKDLREIGDDRAGRIDPQETLYAMITYSDGALLQSVCGASAGAAAAAPGTPSPRYATPLHAWYAAMRAGNTAQACMIEGQHPSAADWAVERQYFVSQGELLINGTRLPPEGARSLLDAG